MTDSKKQDINNFDFFDNFEPLITDTSNHELDADDSEDFSDELLMDDEGYEELSDTDMSDNSSDDEDEDYLFSSIDELFMGIDIDSHNLKMQLVLDAPTIIPQLKIPERIASINLSSVLKDIPLDSFITLRYDTLYLIDTGKGDLQDSVKRNKAIFYALLSNSLRHFIQDVIVDPNNDGKFIKEYKEYETSIKELPNSKSIFLPTIKDVAMDLVTFYITAAISAGNDNKSLSTNNIFSQDKDIYTTVMEFVDYSAASSLQDKNLLYIACEFVSSLTSEKQHLLYSNINRTSKDYNLTEPEYVTTIIDNIVKTHPHLPASKVRELSSVYSIIEDDSNLRPSGRGVGGNRGSTQRSNLFNMIKLLSTIEKLLKQTKLSNQFIRLFSSFKAAVAFTLSQNSVEVYFDNLHSSVSSSFNLNHMSPRPNRRYLAQDMILPQLVGKNVNMVFAADYSGSVTEIELKNQFGVVDSILANQKAHTATVMSFCDDIRTVVELDSNEELVDALSRLGENIGRPGGTSFQSIIDYLSSDSCEIDLVNLNLLCIVTADAAGGNIQYTDKFLSEFSGKILFLVDEHYKSSYIIDQYITRPISNANFEREMLFFQSK